MTTQGKKLLTKFCEANNIPMPAVRVADVDRWPFTVCAFYRNNVIDICVEACAYPGTHGRNWSWPGNTVDRTPYGVIQHELGHHVDMIYSSKKSRDRYFGDFSKHLRALTDEKPISGYAPNDGEWFAEMFRLFVTNPHLLKLLRPLTYQALRNKFRPAEKRKWRTVLGDAPERTIKSARNKIDKEEKRRTKQLNLLIQPKQLDLFR